MIVKSAQYLKADFEKVKNRPNFGLKMSVCQNFEVIFGIDKLD